MVHHSRPALQVICLGSGGGPSEDNVTGFLVRSIASKWREGSVLAVDAGSHLGSIIRILQLDFPLVSADTRILKKTPPKPTGNGRLPRQTGENSETESPVSSSRATSEDRTTTTLKSGPFAGLPFPFESARANAAHILREHVSTYLITHPHLDHLSGFAINTAALTNTSRPKRLAALPSTVNAIKQHVFNDVLWPNLTDEDAGVGFVTFQRLVEGGNPMVGEGHGSGYIEVCDGLGVKGFKVSHGHCMRGGPAHIHRGSNPSISTEAGLGGAAYGSSGPLSGDGRRTSFGLSQPGTPAPWNPSQEYVAQCVIDSSAFFIRDHSSSREVLIFGDVEPDSISLSPRTINVWREAAPKIAAGILRAIFIECSYSDEQGDGILFGHLAPRHLIAELSVLAEMVRREREQEADSEHPIGRKRKRERGHTFVQTRPPSSRPRRNVSDAGPRRPSNGDDVRMSDVTTLSATPEVSTPLPLPLKGVKIIIIHVKDTLKDGPLVGDLIAEQLAEHEAGLQSEGNGLGCEFIISSSGASYYF